MSGEIDSWEDEARTLGVTSTNWLDAPASRAGFRRVGRLVRTATISRGEGPVLDLRATSAISAASRSSTEGRTIEIAAMLDETYTNGFLVIHDGVVLCERYFNGMAPSDTTF